MEDHQQKRGRTLGTEVGVISFVLLLVVIAVPVLFVAAMGEAHCEPKPQCLDAEKGYRYLPAYLLLAAVLISVFVRWLIIQAWGPISARSAPTSVRKKSELLAFGVIATACFLAWAVAATT
jgi:predicted transporter